MATHSERRCGILHLNMNKFFNLQFCFRDARTPFVEHIKMLTRVGRCDNFGCEKFTLGLHFIGNLEEKTDGNLCHALLCRQCKKKNFLNNKPLFLVRAPWRKTVGWFTPGVRIRNGTNSP